MVSYFGGTKISERCFPYPFSPRHWQQSGFQDWRPDAESNGIRKQARVSLPEVMSQQEALIAYP